jgi:ABC-type bacteriocin/lantibiotic exporter with double-glycine peptidase domain
MSSIRISAAMRIAYLKALFCQPISVLDTLPPGQTTAIITITANTLQTGISEKLSMLLQSISLVITALITAFRYNWLLTLVTSSGLLFIIVFYSITIPFLVKMMKEVEHADRMSSSIASEVFGSIRMVAACEAEGKMAKRYESWVQESRRRGLLMSPLVAIQQSPGMIHQNLLLKKLQLIYQSFLPFMRRCLHLITMRDLDLLENSTFALSFWYAIKLYLEFKISSVTTIIM